MAFLIRVLQLLLALSLLVFIHELGHFSFAKIFGIRVEKFFLFFDVKGLCLFSTKRTKWFARCFPRIAAAETEYGIGWLPLGGYCKISGMLDESGDKEFLNHEPEPWEMRTHPAWQRLLVMLGGVLFNFMLAIIAFISIMYIWGESYVSNSENEIYVNELAYDMGFRTGDRILSMDDYVPENFGMLQADLVRRNVHVVKVLRDGDTLSVHMDRSRVQEMLGSPDMFSIAVPFVVDTIPPASVNFGSGLEKGDRIFNVGGRPVKYVQDSRSALVGMKDTLLNVSLLRGEDTLSVPLRVNADGRLDIISTLPGIRVREFTVLQSIPSGIGLAWETLGGYLRDLKMVATPSTGAYKSVGSFISIGKAFPDRWDWYRFLYMVALLSIMLGVMNLLPIPMLDGCYVLYAVYEMITGREVGKNFILGANFVGMILLMLLMLLAFSNDIIALF